ncbi:MAG: LysR family transcriptional regulator [Micropepsaceae bacterium]
MMDARLKYIVAVARMGSFTRAAESVGVTQSAVTKSVADLERQLGFTVFHRTSRGVSLTEPGRDFIDHAARVLADVDELLTGDRFNREPYAGRLRIGVCPDSLEWLLIEPLAALARRYNKIHFEITGANAERTTQLLRRGDVDVVVGLHAVFEGWTEFKQTRLAPLESEMFARKSHPILSIPKAGNRELVRYDFIVPSESQPYSSHIRALFDAQGVDWKTKIHVVDYFPIVKKLVLTTDAISVIAKPYTAARKFTKDFVTFPAGDLGGPAPLCCAYRARWSPGPITRAFIAAMETAYPAVLRTRG